MLLATALWKRLDLPGHAAVFNRQGEDWQLLGTAVSGGEDRPVLECGFPDGGKSAAAVDIAKLPTLPSQPGPIDSKQGRMPGFTDGAKDK